MKKLLLLLCAVLVCGLLCVPVSAQENLAQDITADTKISGSGYAWLGFLTDGNKKGFAYSDGNVELTLENEAGMGSLYLIFDLEYGPYTITDNQTGKSATAGEQNMLHELVDLTALFGTAPISVTLHFQQGKVALSELRVFSTGDAWPEDVQVWQPCAQGETDLLLLSTHGDDDQLYFAGLLPTYATRPETKVQVVYLTNHRNLNRARTHEMLNGLWAVGVRCYPVFGTFPDFRIDDMEKTYAEYERLGYSRDDLCSFVVEQIRRFKPQVVVAHDINGEYGHGMHQVYTDLAIQALDLSNNAEAFPESAERYGVWDIPKMYIHLYEENPIVMDYDTPMEAFDGLTAFQVSQKLGFPCHESQQKWIMFTAWMYGNYNQITKASEIETFSPCQFGLYRSMVGEDVDKNDFLEHIIPYETQKRLEAERLEQERLEAERKEQERLEAERKEQERLEAERKEQERLEAERKEQERLEAQRRQEEQERRKPLILGGVLLVLVAALAVCIVLLRRRKK